MLDEKSLSKRFARKISLNFHSNGMDACNDEWMHTCVKVRTSRNSCASEHVRSTRWRRSTAKRGLRARFGAASLFIWAKLLCLWPPWWGNSVVRIYLCLSLSVSRASRKSRIMGNENSTRRNVWTGLQLGRSLTLSTRTIPVFIGTTRQFSHKSSEWN